MGSRGAHRQFRRTGGVVWCICTARTLSVDSRVCTTACTGGGVWAGSAAATGEAGGLKAVSKLRPGMHTGRRGPLPSRAFPPGPHPTGLSASWPHGGGAVPPGGLPDPGSYPDLSPDRRRGISRSNRETRGIGSPVVRMETALGLFLCQDAPCSGWPGAPESRFGNGAEEGLPGSRPSLEGLRARPCRGPGHLLPQAWSLSPRPWLPALTLLLHGHSSLSDSQEHDGCA